MPNNSTLEQDETPAMPEPGENFADILSQYERSHSHKPEAGGQEEPLEVGLLIVAFNSVLARIPPRALVVTGRTWTLQEKLDLITDRMLRGPIELVELILESEDRLEAVVTFVAVLELLRRSLVVVRQKERFGAIHVEAREQPAGE